MCGSSKVTKSFKFFYIVPQYIDSSLDVHGHRNRVHFIGTTVLPIKGVIGTTVVQIA